MISTRLELLHELYNNIHMEIIQSELALESITEKSLEIKTTKEDTLLLQKKMMTIQFDIDNKGKALNRVSRWIDKEEKEIEKRVKERSKN